MPTDRSPWAEGPRVEPGQDEIGRRIPSLGRRQIFPRTALRTAGEGAERSEAGEGAVGGMTEKLFRGVGYFASFVLGKVALDGVGHGGLAFGAECFALA